MKVWLSGRLMEPEEVEHLGFMFASPSVTKIKKLLYEAKVPMNVEELAKETGQTIGYTRILLRRQVKKGLVLELKAVRSNILYYLLTELGSQEYVED